jgi:hypothetical protein
MTSGPIIEFGVGQYSTPILLEFSRIQHRQLISLESNLNWHRQLSQTYPHADIRLTQDWLYPILEYGVAFIDHGVVAQRIVDIAKLANTAKTLVIHDTEAADYEYDKIWHLFLYRKDWTERRPFATLVSNFIEL